MKLSTLLVASSLALNAALALVYFSRSSSATTSATPAAPGSASSASSITPRGNSSAATRTSATSGKNAAVSWAALNTGDLRALATRLRVAGFPPAVVRAVVAAQLNETFRARREQLLPKIEDRPFWQTDPRGGSLLSLTLMDPQYRTASRELAREHARMLKDILGPDAMPASAAANENQVRRYGNLSQDKIEQLQRLDQDYNDMRSEVTLAARGMTLPEDREKLAILEREKRADLAQLLTPAEAEDYLLRTSQTTTRLRQALTTFNANEDEFKAIYKVQAAYDEKYSPALGGITSAEQRNERLAAQTQVAEETKAALGEARYAEFARASDREYQQLSTMAKQAGVPESAAIAVVDLRENLLKESNRIFGDTTLNNDQKRAAIQGLAQTARTQAVSTLGAELGPKYLQIAERWLNGLERGAAVTMTSSVNGSSMSTRPVPPARPAVNPGAVPQAQAPR